MGKYFGTDGIRAVAGQFPLVDDFVTKLGYVALRELQKSAQAKHLKPQVIIAQDSRLSNRQAAYAELSSLPVTIRPNLTVLNFLPIMVLNSRKI